MNSDLTHLLRRFVLSALVLIATTASGQSRDLDSENQDESSIRKTARLRQYPGGADEEPLKVQEQLPTIKKDGDNEVAAPEPIDAD